MHKKEEAKLSELYNRIASLCERRGISVGKMCNQLGISRGNLTELKMGRIKTLKSDNLTKIAGYFDTSVDFLLGNEDHLPRAAREREIVMDDFTYALYNESRDLTPENKEKLLEMAKFFKQQQQNQGK